MSSLNDWRLLLPDKVVFITGGAGWLARHIAKTCFDHGARIVLADLNSDRTNEVINEAFGSQSKDDRILSVQLDISNEDSIKNAVEIVLKKWDTIHVLVNNAAIFTLGEVEHVSADAWSRIMEVNIRGFALVTKYIAPLLKAQKNGSIINMASAGGLVAHSMFLPYSTTKGAIIQMTRNLALDLGPFNVRVNSLSPGAIDSPTLHRTAAEQGVDKQEFDKIHGGKCIQRLGHPQEIANLVVFLASGLCPFITGSNIVIDGGYTIV